MLDVAAGELPDATPLTGDLTGNGHLCAKGAGLNDLAECPVAYPLEVETALKARGDTLGLDDRIELRDLDLADLDVRVLQIELPLEGAGQLLDLMATASDDAAWPEHVQDDAGSQRRALDLSTAVSHASKAIVKELLDLELLDLLGDELLLDSHDYRSSSTTSMLAARSRCLDRRPNTIDPRFQRLWRPP